MKVLRNLLFFCVFLGLCLGALVLYPLRLLAGEVDE
jgi:hypothetical protein